MIIATQRFAMHRIRLFLTALGLAAALSGCMMNVPPSRGEAGAQGLIATATSGYNVAQINVTVPRSLRVSEENSFKPSADIVWHGDAAGDRYAQVTKILRDGMVQGTRGFRSGRAVVLDVQLVRFHALTPKTRYTIGGKHELIYLMTLRDGATGEVIIPTHKANATVRGAGGAKADAEEAQGITQTIVIREALARSIQRELSFGSSKKGLFGLVSRDQQSPSDAPLN